MLAVLAGGYIAIQTSCNGKAGSFLQPQVTIADLKVKQSVFADSLVTLHDVKIESCESVLNYSKAVITDESGEEIPLLSAKPFRKGERTDVQGKMFTIYQNEHEGVVVFVDENLFGDLQRLMHFR